MLCGNQEDTTVRFNSQKKISQVVVKNEHIMGVDDALILKYEAMICELKSQLLEKEKLLEQGEKIKSNNTSQKEITKYIEELDIKLSQAEIDKISLEQEILRLKSQVIVSEEVQPFLLTKGPLFESCSKSHERRLSKLGSKLFKSTTMALHAEAPNQPKVRMSVIEEENSPNNPRRLSLYKPKYIKNCSLNDDLQSSLLEMMNEGKQKSSNEFELMKEIDIKFFEDQLHSRDEKIKQLEEMLASSNKDKSDQLKKINALEVKLQAAEDRISQLIKP